MTHYQTLGVTENATEAEIRKAYKKLAMRSHPDRNKGDAQAEAEFKKIAEAYSILSDKKKRDEYDSSLRSPHFEFGDGMDFDETIRRFFSDSGGLGGFGFSHRPRQAALRIEVPFWEAALGIEKELRVKTQSGTKTVKISIPSLTESGDAFETLLDGERVAFVVFVSEDPVYSRNGLDVHIKLQIPFYVAALGGTIKIPHWSKGFLNVRVRQGVQPGQTLKLSGAGFQSGSRIGDAYLKISVSVPKQTSESQKKAIEALSKEFQEPSYESLASWKTVKS